MRVPWDTISIDEFNLIASLILKQMHPTVLGVNGSGGDGGIDLHFRDEETGDHTIFQLKSFNGRLNGGGRKRQITRSLERARSQNPTEWVLVMRIEPTSGEEEWLDDLQDDLPFNVEWKDRLWLDDQLVDRPDIVRYVLEDGARELARNLKELQDVRVATLADGLPDAVRRFRDLARQASALSPHYRFRWIIDDEQIRVETLSKYPGAETDSPLQMTLTLGNSNMDAAKIWAEGMEYLTRYGLMFELSVEDVGAAELALPDFMGPAVSPNRIVFAQTSERQMLHGFELELLIRDENGSEVGSLPVLVTDGGVGSHGFAVRAQHKTGMLKLVVRVDVESKRMHLGMSTELPSGLMPADALETLRWIDSLSAASTFEVLVPGKGLMFAGEIGADLKLKSPAGRSVLEKLARLQEASAVEFPIPDELSPEDLGWIEVGAKLLDGQAAEIPWRSVSLTLTPSSPDALASLKADGLAQIPKAFGIRSEIAMPIAGHVLPLGEGWMQVPAGVIDNSAREIDRWSMDSPVVLTVSKVQGSPPVTITLFDQPSSGAQIE